MYYFLIAQLPYLSYGQPAAISRTAFYKLCRQHLSKAHLALLEHCVCGVGDETLKPTASAFINNWRKHERALATHIAHLRALRLKRDGEEAAYKPGWDPDTENIAKTAVSMDNPLEAEIFLDKGRWDTIEYLQGNTYFGVNAVYAYMLKLLLIERRAAFKTEEGFGEYKTLYASIMENAPGVGATGDS